MKKLLAIVTPLIFILSLNLAASDTTDAESLRSRCERESKILEVSIINFGEAADMARLKESQSKLKIAKLKIAQSKFKEAIDIYNDYLRSQSSLYSSVAKNYITSTQKLADEVSLEMVDSIDNPKVDNYLKLAYRNLEEAKTAMQRNYPNQVVDACRRSKEYALGTYSIMSKAVPAKYNIDLADIKGNTGK